jgi:hypothetical protein
MSSKQSTEKIDKDEIWKVLKDYPNYEVSSHGNVRRVSRPNKLLKIRKEIRGSDVGMSNDGKVIRKRVSKLVASAFLDAPTTEDKIVVHIDRDIYNNHVSNLKYETRRNRQYGNKRKSERVEESEKSEKSEESLSSVSNKRHMSSVYKGVSLRSNNKWRASIHFDGKHLCLGTFEKEEDAARMYNEKALELFGVDAFLNEISDLSKDQSTKINL